MKIGRDIGILCVMVFFAVMWGLLLRDNLPLDDSGNLSANYGALLQENEENKTVEMGIYYGRSKIGQSVSKIKREVDYVVVDNRCELSVGGSMQFLVPGIDRLKVDLQAHISEESGIKLLRLKCQQLDIELQGIMQGGNLNVSGTVGGEKVKRELSMEDNSFFGQTLSPISEFPDILSLEPGETWTMQVINPIKGRFQNVSVSFQGRKTIEIGDQSMSIGVVLFREESRTWKSYLNENGEILMQGTPYGVTLIREDVEDDLRDMLWDEEIHQKP